MAGQRFMTAVRPALPCPGQGGGVDHAQLQPYRFGAQADRFAHHGAGIRGVAEDVDHVERAGLGQGGDHRLAEQRLARETGVHRRHLIAVLDQETHDAMRWPNRVGGRAHQRDAPRLAQQPPDFGVVQPVHRGTLSALFVVNASAKPRMCALFLRWC